MEGVLDAASLWHLAVQHSPIGMALVATDGGFIMANQALCDMLGYSADELALSSFQELTHPDDLDADLELLEQALSGEIDSYRLSKRYVCADDRIVWGDLSVALVRDADGRPLHFISQILDVTEQRESEERLRAAAEDKERDRRTLEAIFETVSVGLLLIGADGRYERMNRRHAAAMGLAFPDGHNGRSGQLGEVYLLDGQTLMPKEQMPSYRAMQGEEFDDVSYWVGRDPARRIAYSVSARQVRNADGASRGAALAYKDVTDLLGAIQVQDEFVSSVSHELRTPLTSIIGYLELLGEHEGLPAEVGTQLAIVRRNAVRLRALLSDLLHVGEVKAGVLNLVRAKVDLAAVIDEAVQTIRPQAALAGIEIRVDAPSELVAEVDEHRLRQVIDNLIANAVKYSGAASPVDVVLRQTATAVEVEVRDAGMGIAAHETEKVFDRFFRGAGALDSHVPGTGLGLNIARSIVEAHDGSITVDSEVGRGAVFRVTLPTGPGQVAGVGAAGP